MFMFHKAGFRIVYGVKRVLEQTRMDKAHYGTKTLNMQEAGFVINKVVCRFWNLLNRI